MMITGAHAIIYSPEPDRIRTFFDQVLGFRSVDAGGGWLIFALPPAELAAHPAETTGRHELYLMCDEIHAAVEELKGKGIALTGPVKEESCGLVTGLRLPDGGQIGLYQPKHPTPSAG